MNRFTKDVHFMDDLLPMTLYDFIICSFMVLGGTLIIFFVNPWVVLRSVAMNVLLPGSTLVSAAEAPLYFENELS